MDFEFLIEAFVFVLPGVPKTLLLFFGVSLAVMPVAVLIATMRLSKSPALVAVSTSYILLFRSIPLLVLIFLVYYGLPQIDWIRHGPLWVLFREPYYCVLLAAVLNGASYASEVVRGGIQAVPKGQIEAAKSFGMSRWKLNTRVVAPLALKQALPSYGSELILVLKGTSLASTVTIAEITFRSVDLTELTYRPVPIFIAAGAIYLMMNVIIVEVVSYFERRLAIWDR